MTDDAPVPLVPWHAETPPAPAIEESLNGADYRATVRLSTADDVTVADAGETCERVAAQSLRPLLAAGLIEPAAAPASSRVVDDLPRRRAADKEGDV